MRYPQLLSILLFVLISSPALGQKIEINLQELVLTGSLTPDLIHPPSTTSYIVTEKSLEKKANLSIAEILRTVPGLAVSSAGANSTQVRIRGGEGNHTLILIDGIEARGGDGEYYLSGLTGSHIKQIEILRGPQTLFHGASASSGVINIITKQYDAPTSTFFQAGTTNAIGGNVNKKISGFHTSLAFSKEKDQGYDYSDSGGEKDFIDRSNIFLSAKAFNDSGVEIELQTRYAEEHYKYDSTNSSATNSAGYVVDDISLYADRDEGALSLALKWHANKNKHQHKVLFSRTEYSESQNGAKSTQEDQLNSRYLFTKSLDNYELWESTEILTLLIGSYEDENSLASSNSRSGESYALEYNKNWSEYDAVQAGIRQSTSNKFKSATTWKTSASKSFGFRGLSLLLDAGTGVVNPAYSEINGNAAWGIIGNPNLMPEKNHSISAGLRWQRQTGPSYLKLITFKENLKDEIVYVAATTTYANKTEDSKRKGIEFDSLLEVTEKFNITGTYTYLVAKDTNDTPEIRRPRHTAIIAMNYRPESLFSDVSLVARRVEENLDSQFWGNYETKKLPDFTVFDFSAISKFNETTSLSFEINNITDKTHYDVWGYANRGRSGWIKLNREFQLF